MLPNEQKKINNQIKPEHKEVILIKLAILVVIIVFLLFILVMCLAQSFSVFKPRQTTNNTNQAGQVPTGQPTYDFKAPLPPGSAGDISNVPKEKIDSLFNNLKN